MYSTTVENGAPARAAATATTVRTSFLFARRANLPACVSGHVRQIIRGPATSPATNYTPTIRLCSLCAVRASVREQAADDDSALRCAVENQICADVFAEISNGANMNANSR